MAQRIRIRRLVFFAVVGWAGVIWTVRETNPYRDGEGAVLLFFLALSLALFGSYSLGAWALSFMLFHGAAQRGNLAYASEQGILLTSLTLILILLSVYRSITPLSMLILVAVFLLWQVILLVRTARVRT